MQFYSKNILRGSALAYGLVIMATVMILLTSILTFVASQIKNSLYQASKEQAFRIAESGIGFYQWYLAHETDGRTAQQIQSFWNGGSAYGVGSAYEANYLDPAGSVIGRYRIEVTPPIQGSTIVIVKSTGWTLKYPDSKRSVQVRFRRPSWSENAVLANDFMRFGSGTEVFGPIHSNLGIRFDGLAHNLITSSVGTFNDPDHAGGNEFGVHTHIPPVDPLPPSAVPARTNVFEAGREFPVASIDFNGVLGDLSYMRSQAISSVNGSRYFNNSGQGRHIILKTNGTYDVRTVNSFHTMYNNIVSYSGGWSNYPIPNNGVIYVEDNVWLQGQVNGKKVTVVAADLGSGASPNVFIEHSIRYTNYDGSDVIGVIAEGDVEVIQTSDNNIRIDAGLLAQTGRVGREYYSVVLSNGNWFYCPCAWAFCEDHKTTITIYGAIATNQRYGFAWGDNCPRSTGYVNRNLYYDNNLLYYPPPYFPTGTQYFMDLWEEL